MGRSSRKFLSSNISRARFSVFWLKGRVGDGSNVSAYSEFDQSCGRILNNLCHVPHFCHINEHIDTIVNKVYVHSYGIKDKIQLSTIFVRLRLKDDRE